MTTIPMPFPWSNWIGDYASGGATLVAPATVDDLVNLVVDAVSSGKRLRVSGARHSTSSVARPDHLWVTLDSMQDALELEHLKSSVDTHNLARIHAGARVKTASRILLGGKALHNMGSFDWQSLVGALCTGTHGSGIGLGAIADSVRSIDMVTVRKVDGNADVRMRRIEPANGITDPGRFASGEREMELIQDDDTFYSAVVSFGCMGLVHSIVLDVRDAYWLREKSDAKTWFEVRELLRFGADGSLPTVLTRNRHWELVVNSAQSKGPGATNNPLCVVIKRNIIADQTKPADWRDRDKWPPLRQKTSLMRRLTEQYGRPAIDGSGSIMGIVGLGNLIKNNLINEAEEPPFENNLDFSRNFWVLRRERDDTTPREAPDPPPESISTEIAVPVEHTVAAVDRVLEIMRDSKYFYAVPFGVRFVAASPHYLAPQYARDTCMIEIPLVLPNSATKRAEQMPDFKRALADIEKALCYGNGHLGGRPHWGQYNELNRARLESLYEKLPTFERVYSEHNAFGTFDNAYTRQLGLVRTEPVVDETESSSALRIAVDHLFS